MLPPVVWAVALALSVPAEDEGVLVLLEWVLLDLVLLALALSGKARLRLTSRRGTTGSSSVERSDDDPRDSKLVETLVVLLVLLRSFAGIDRGTLGAASGALVGPGGAG